MKVYDLKIFKNTNDITQTTFPMYAKFKVDVLDKTREGALLYDGGKWLFTSFMDENKHIPLYTEIEDFKLFLSKVKIELINELKKEKEFRVRVIFEPPIIK